MARAIGVALVVAAALADSAAAPEVAFYALVAAVPAAAVAALASYGAFLEDGRPIADETLPALHALLAVVALGLIVLGCAVRGPAVGADQVPALASTALVGVLAVYLIDVVAAGLVHVRPRRAAETG